MDAVKLLNRTDTKFVIPKDLFVRILPLLKENYKVLEIKNKRVAQYKTLYFDTDDFDFYTHHHNGWPNRYKVRMRKYIDSGLCYLEIKNKKKGRTIKKRIQIADFEEEMSETSLQFISDVIPNDILLIKKLWNSFNRITLVNKIDKERLTLDIGLGFQWNEEDLSLENVIIGEVKQEKVNRKSPFMKLIKENGVRPMRVSKYCIGAKLLYPELKNNRFKQKHIHINKINELVS
jgi:hypothetical protein